MDNHLNRLQPIIDHSTIPFRIIGIRWQEPPGIVRRRVRAKGCNLDTGEQKTGFGQDIRKPCTDFTFRAQMGEIGL